MQYSSVKLDEICDYGKSCTNQPCGRFHAGPEYTYSTQPCRYGGNCRSIRQASGCQFHHPEVGRLIQAQIDMYNAMASATKPVSGQGIGQHQPSHGQASSTPICRYDGRCNRQGCHFRHIQGQKLLGAVHEEQKRGKGSVFSMGEMKKELTNSIKDREQDLIRLNELCPVCIDPYTPGTAQMYFIHLNVSQKLYFLTNCSHVLHRECIKNYITTGIDGGKTDITCIDPKCKKALAPEDIYRNTSDDQRGRLDKLNFDKAMAGVQDQSWCPTANCGYAFVFNPARDTQFNCPLCKKRYCLNCRAEQHPKQTCQEYQAGRDPQKAENAFQQWVVGAKIKQCPFCKFWVEKSQGCDHMRCRCGKEFCYKCGGVYRQCACMGR